MITLLDPIMRGNDETPYFLGENVYMFRFTVSHVKYD